MIFSISRSCGESQSPFNAEFCALYPTMARVSMTQPAFIAATGIAQVMSRTATKIFLHFAPSGGSCSTSFLAPQRRSRSRDCGLWWSQKVQQPPHCVLYVAGSRVDPHIACQRKSHRCVDRIEASLQLPNPRCNRVVAIHIIRRTSLTDFRVRAQMAKV